MTWEQRWHPLRREWVVVAAHRQNRPWVGETVEVARTEIPPHDDNCHFCPRNTRVHGSRNPDYEGTFVFDNDHPCVGPAAPVDLDPAPGIMRNRRADGLARVVCYTPRHDLSLATLPASGIDQLLQTLSAQYHDLGGRPEVAHVLAFENRGEVVGVSNPHPHCQLYATNFVFKTIETEVLASREHWQEHKRVLFADIIASELQDRLRILYENDSAIAFIPYFARYAYEVYVAPKATHASLHDLSDGERRDLSLALQHVLVKYDNLWQMPFPYVMVLHQAPTDGGDYGSFHFHIEFHPPLRQPHLLKYLAGPEIGGGNFLSDTAPEAKAAELRSLPDVHYLESPT